MIKKNNTKSLPRASREGISLIEILLYLSLSSIIMVSSSIFFFKQLEVNNKNNAVMEIEESGSQITRLITQIIRNGTAINSPGQGTSANSLSLATLDPLKDPTIFDLSGGEIRITEGLGAPTTLVNSTKINADSLNFDNFSKNLTPGIIKINFTLTHKNPENRSEYNYSKTFYDSASLKQ